MRNSTKIFLHSEKFQDYGYPAACPFNTSRAGKTKDILESMGLLSGDDRREEEPVPADRVCLEKFHKPSYLHHLKKASDGALSPREYGMGLGTPDCPVFPGMYEYAVLASGATVTGAKLILEGKVGIAFNPSGGYHHAGPEQASGSCYINDVVLGIITLTEAGRKVLFLDVDVHHCDGVQDAFYRRKDVMTISMHESGRTLFPGTGFEEETGEGEGKGYSVNLPMPVGTDDEAYLKAFNEAVFPLMKAYDPDVVVMELGMDSLSGDPLAHLSLTNNAYAEIVEKVMTLNKPILATGGGGYNVENTTRGWALIWSVLCGDQDQHDPSIGLGGVMLGTSEWRGGLRDRVLLSHGGLRKEIDSAISATIGKIESLVFPVHGL